MRYAQVVHCIPGRCRLRLDEFGSDPEFADGLMQQIHQGNPPIAVRLNLAARSLIATYDPDQLSDQQVYDVLDTCIQRVKQGAVVQSPHQDVWIAPTPHSIEPETDFSDLTPLINRWQDLRLPAVSLGLALLAAPLELPVLLVGGAIAAAALPWLNRASESLVNHHQPNTDLLDTLWMGLHTLQGNFVAPALKTCLVESRRTLRGLDEPMQLSSVNDPAAQATLHQELIAHLIQTQPIHDTQLGAVQAQRMRDAIAPTLLMGGAIFAVTGNLSAAIAPFQLDFGSGVPISISTTLLTALGLAVQHGVYIRSAGALERLAQVDTLVIDRSLLRSGTGITKAAIATLQAQGITLYVLQTDDSDVEITATVAQHLGIPAPHLLWAADNPEQIDPIKRLQCSGKRVAVFGDRLSCQAALARADVSIIEMPVVSTFDEIVNQPIDVALLQPDWHRLVDAIALARRAMERVHENAALILLPNLVVTCGGVFFGLNPAVNVIVNNGSAFVVEFLNNQRPLVDGQPSVSAQPDPTEIHGSPPPPVTTPI